MIDGNLEILLKSLHGISTDMERQVSGVMYATMSEVCERSGQTIDQGGKPFGAEAFLEALKAIEFGVNRNGEVVLPQVHVHPEVGDKLVEDLSSRPPEFQDEIEKVKREKSEAALRRETERKQRFKSGS